MQEERTTCVTMTGSCLAMLLLVLCEIIIIIFLNSCKSVFVFMLQVSFEKRLLARVKASVGFGAAALPLRL